MLAHSSGLGDIGMKILGWVHFEDDPACDQTQLLKENLPNYKKLKDAVAAFKKVQKTKIKRKEVRLRFVGAEREDRGMARKRIRKGGSRNRKYDRY